MMTSEHTMLTARVNVSYRLWVTVCSVASSAVTCDPLWSDSENAPFGPFWFLPLGNWAQGWLLGRAEEVKETLGAPSTRAGDQGLSLSLLSPTVSWRRLKDLQPLAPFSSASCLGSRETVWPFLQLNLASWPDGRGASQEGVG